MDAREYKQVTSQPDVFSRADLDATLTVLRDELLRDSLGEALTASPIPKPPLHEGAPESDCFRLALPPGTAEEILDELGRLDASAVSANGHTTPEASRIGDLVDFWSRYRAQRG